MRNWLAGLAFVGAVGLLAAPAIADREPTPAERTAIEEALRSQGFVSWDDIELDDDYWEVNDAQAADGRVYDLLLDVTTLRVVEQELDDDGDDDDDDDDTDD